MPTIPVLQRILAVLDEELLIGVQQVVDDDAPERVIDSAPVLAEEPPIALATA
jgi:hypothetical protein